MMVLGIDPGPHTSGVCLYDATSNRVHRSQAAASLEAVFEWLGIYDPFDWSSSYRFVVAIEAIEALYAHVGKETVRTIHLTGRIHQRALDICPEVVILSPKDVTKIVCGTGAANDSAVRQALIDQVGPKGKKATPGPTYGVSSHAWRALAVAVAVSRHVSPGQSFSST